MRWLTYFEENRNRSRRIPWESGISLDPTLLDPLLSSLRRFQLGESGDGVHLIRRARATGDADYAACALLFVAEEMRHAEWMKRVLDMFGVDSLRSHWTDVAFLLVRRAMGLHTELMAFLAAEMIGLHYFRMLRDGVRDPLLRAMFGEIVEDESGHISFHADRLRGWYQGLPSALRLFPRLFMRGLYEIATLVVLFDHRRLLRALDISPQHFLQGCDRIYDATAAQLFSVGGGTNGIGSRGPLGEIGS